MANETLEVIGIDCITYQHFVVYFSDNTFAEVSASTLAACFPNRQVVPAPEEGD